jgi:hypothetical protein
MLTAWARRTDEGLLQVLLADVQGPQPRFQCALFFLTHAVLAHLCIYRSDRNDVMAQVLALSKHRKSQLDILRDLGSHTCPSLLPNPDQSLRYKTARSP